MSSGLEKIFTQKAVSDIKREIVVELLDSTKNLDEKTELDKPLIWSTLHSMKKYIEEKGLENSAKIIEKFTNQSFKYLISKKRQGRKEYIEALNSLAQLESKEEPKSLLGTI